MSQNQDQMDEPQEIHLSENATLFIVLASLIILLLMVVVATLSQLPPTTLSMIAGPWLVMGSLVLIGLTFVGLRLGYRTLRRRRLAQREREAQQARARSEQFHALGFDDPQEVEQRLAHGERVRLTADGEFVFEKPSQHQTKQHTNGSQ